MAEPKILTILDYDFSVTAPYEAGHTLTEGEAKSLNQTRKENLGNNFRSTVRNAIEAAGDGGAVDHEDLKAQFAVLDSKYVFTLATVAASRKLDPVEREIRNLIKGALREQLAGETPARKLSDLDEDQLEAIIDANMENPEIVKVAKKTVADRQKVAGFALQGTTAPAA